MKAWLKSLAPRDLRADIALAASIGGTMALTLIVIWLIYIFWRGGWSIGTELARIDKLGLIAILLTAIMGVTMTSLGLAINRRSVKGGFMGASFEATGGDDSTISNQTVAAAAAGAAAGATTPAPPIKADELPKP